MTTLILAFIKNLKPTHYALILLSLALVYATITLKILDFRLERAKHNLTVSEFNLQQCTLATQDLKAAITKQNAAVISLRETSRNNEHKFNTANKELHKIQSNTKTLINELMKKTVPTECSGAMKNLSDFTIQFSKEYPGDYP